MSPVGWGVGQIRMGIVDAVNTLYLPGTAGNYVSTPDSASNSPSAQLDLRVKVSLPDWSPATTMTLISKWSGGSNGFMFRANTNGTLNFLWSTTGADATGHSSLGGHGFANGAVKWVRVTRDVTPQEVNFYISDDGITWAQLGATLAAGALNIFNSTAPLEIGTWNAGASDPLNATVYYADLRTTIGGAPTQTFDATAVTKLGTRNPSTVAAGGPWTLNGSAWDWVPA